jgi:hypothetical protein
VVDLPDAAMQLVVRDIASEVARLSAANADATFGGRSRLTRTDLSSRVTQLVELIDLGGLEAAIRAGVCSPFQQGSPSVDADRYYEGISTQPGHVAAGLVVTAPEEVEAILSSLIQVGALVITGPSGVGKSALLWSVPDAAPGILWFRVHRLQTADSISLVRLARAWEASPERPVGFLVDAAGTSAVDGWSSLRTHAAEHPGIYLLATARSEDLVELGSLRDTASVEAQLSPAIAERIFEGLVARGATRATHWEEAYEESSGLTLEFTHILSQGRRLEDVIEDQVSVRVQESRELELEVMTLASVAGRWSIPIGVDELTRTLQVAPHALRRALSRLLDEHILVEASGSIEAMHPVRSAAMSRAIHRAPPPTLIETIARLLPAVTTSNIARLVSSLLFEQPELIDDVHRAAATDIPTVARLAAYLRGFQLAAFLERAEGWRTVAENAGLARAQQPLAFNFAIAGMEAGDFFPLPFRTAVEGMAAIQLRRDGRALLAGLRPQDLVSLIASATWSELEVLLHELDGLDDRLLRDIEPAIADIDLSGASIVEIASLVAAARAASVRLAHVLRSAAGEESLLLERLGHEVPWVIETSLRETANGRIGHGRLLIDQTGAIDPREQAVAFGRLLLRLFPDIAQVDVKSLFPGGREFVIEGHDLGSSGLLRRYDHTSAAVAWNRERMAAATALIGQSDTERLESAKSIVQRLQLVLDVAAETFVSAGAFSSDPQTLADEVNRLDEAARGIGPAVGRRSGGHDSEESWLTDDVSGFLTDITSNVLPRLAQQPLQAATLSEHIDDHVLMKSMVGFVKQPWNLVGLDGPPPEAAAIGRTLTALRDVLRELGRDPSSGQSIIRRARSTRREWAVQTAADEALRRRRTARTIRNSHIASAVAQDPNLRMIPVATDDSGERIVVEMLLGTVLDWPELTQRASAVFEALAETDLPPIRLIPVRGDAAIPSLVLEFRRGRLVSAPIGEDEVGTLRVVESPLADALASAISAISALSSLEDLPPAQGDNPEVVHFRANAELELAMAQEALRTIGSDPVTSHVEGYVEAVRREWRNGSSSIATTVSSDLLDQDLSDFTRDLLAARLLSLEWDHDRDSAREFLERLAGAE